MRYQFKIDQHERIVITDNWITNGCWAVTKKIIRDKIIPSTPSSVLINKLKTPFKKVINIENGLYNMGLKHGLSGDSNGYEERLEEYLKPEEPLKEATITGKAKVTETAIERVELKSKECDLRVWIDPSYIPLTWLGDIYIYIYIYISGEKKPILIKSIDDEILAIVMPMRGE